MTVALIPPALTERRYNSFLLRIRVNRDFDAPVRAFALNLGVELRL